MTDHQDLRKLLIEAREYMGHRSACQGSLCPVCNLRVRIDDALAEPVEPMAWKWIAGAPPKPWCNEWFIARTTSRDRVVLTALPEEYAYDFKTADDTYIKADKIVCWMQFPDSQYIAAPADQWRRVEDGLPEKDKAVIIRTDTEISMGWLSDDRDYPFYFVGNDEIANCELDGTIETNAWADGRVTHWMPLPALPESDK